MNSNVIFESNIYPIRESKSVATDEVFLSKIWDYNRLRQIKSRHYEALFSDVQKRIVNEQPYCALNPGDPCWGVVKTRNGYKWVSMCTNASCPRFERECRVDIPFDEEQESCFIPKKNEDDYGYEAFINNYYAFPIESGESLLDSYGSPGVIPRRNGEDDYNRILKSSILSFLNSEREKKDEEKTLRDYIEEKQELPVDIIETIDTDYINTIFECFEECSQEEIISAESNCNYFIDAGPGTGKTYTLINKINHLVSEGGVDPEGIMVLCFTNAAVDEIKKRLRQFVKNGADRGLANVDIRTFHSFAGWLINQANDLFTDQGWKECKWQYLDYESSLLKATEIIRLYADDVISNWEYFIVDEVQDLTNTLARFVLEIVKNCLSYNCGVTVLGDACQAIYDYEQECKGIPLDSKGFYSELFELMKNRSRFVFLTENYRQNDELKEINKCLRDAILSGKKQNMKHALELIINAVDEVQFRKPEDIESESESGKKKCLLLRSNLQTLKQSSDLRKMGISHTLNVNDVKDNYAPWIADVFSEFDGDYIDEDELRSRLPDEYQDLSDTIWTRLQMLLHKKSDELNVRDILDSIALSKIDDPVFRSNVETNIIVSNIHRAKGREYDCVVIDKSFAKSLLKTSANPDEYKVLYVALTRPKNEVYFCNMQSSNERFTKWTFHNSRQRQVRFTRNVPSFMEFKGESDVPPLYFIKTKAHVFNEIKPGDAVKFVRHLDGTKVKYSIIHELSEAKIGYVGKDYIEDFKTILHLGESELINMPSEIDDIYISGVYSYIADSDYLERIPEIKEMSPNGVWKWVSFVGIGHAKYDVY